MRDSPITHPVVFLLAILLPVVAWCGAQDLIPIPPAQTQQIDQQFAQLMAWNADLDRRTGEWNQKCAHIRPLDEACLTVKKLLDNEEAAYIAVAESYHSTGEGCEAEMRNKLVQRVVALYRWNIKCAGLGTEKQCMDESDRLDKEGIELHIQIEKCIGALQNI